MGADGGFAALGAELLLCLLREDGAGELKWNLLHLDPGGSKLQQLPPGLRLLGWARQLSPEQMFEGCGFGFFLEIAPSAATALPKLAALLLEQKHWMLEMLCQPAPAPRCCQRGLGVAELCQTWDPVPWSWSPAQPFPWRGGWGSHPAVSWPQTASPGCTKTVEK